MRDDPELAFGVENDGDGFEEGGSDGPAAAEELDGVVWRAAALEVDGEVQIAERGGRCGLELGAVFLEGDLPGLVGDEAGGAAGFVGVVPGDLLGEQGVGGGEVGDAGGAQERDEAVLKSAEAPFDFAFRLRVWGDAVGDAQAEQRALELRAHIIWAGVGRGAEEGKTVGVVGAWGAVSGDGRARAAEVRPGRFARLEGTGDDFARVVVEREQEDGLGGSGPPVVRGGVVLPQLADGAGLPAAAGLWAGLGRGGGERGQMQAAPRSDGGARAVEVQTAREFIGEQGEIDRAAVREELAGEAGGVLRPRRGVIAAAGQRTESSGIAQPAMTQRVELGAIDFQAGTGGVGVAAARVEVGEDGGDEGGRQAVAELLFIHGADTAGRGDKSPQCREGFLHPIFGAQRRPSLRSGRRCAPNIGRFSPSKDPVRFCSNNYVRFCSNPDSVFCPTAGFPAGCRLVQGRAAMKKSTVLLIVLAVSAAGFGAWKMAGSLRQAGALGDAAVGEFHERFNAADDAAIFENGSGRFKTAVPLDKLRELNTHLRARLGHLKSAERSGIHLNTRNGDTTLEVNYAASFESGPARETFLFDYNTGVPALLQFLIESKALEEK